MKKPAVASGKALYLPFATCAGRWPAACNENKRKRKEKKK